MLSRKVNGKLDDDEYDVDDGLPSGVFAYVLQNRPRKTKKTCGKDQPRPRLGHFSRPTLDIGAINSII